MQKSLIKTIGRKNDAIAIDLAGVFNVSSSYVNKIINDTEAIKYKGEKAAAIRKAYKIMKNGKSKLIQSVEKLVPFSKAS